MGSMVGWTFVKRVVPAVDDATGQLVWPPIVFQIVILDDLIPLEDRRVDVADGPDRRNLVFAYDTSPAAVLAESPGPVLGLQTEQVALQGEPGSGRYIVRSRGDADSDHSAALTVLLERLPLVPPTK